jgi:hypothetical protein
LPIAALLGLFGAGPALAPFPADCGAIDVTKAPYLAKGDGQTDDTEALQAAINDWTGKRRIIYLPNGIYRVRKTLAWPGKDRQGQQVWGFTEIRGQSREGTLIRLDDRTFTDPAHVAPVMTAGPHGSADWFANFVRDLTIDIGSGNPGATGLRFFSNNTGALRNVSIVSRDGLGSIGLDLGYNDMNGPLLVKGLEVRGFDVGVSTGYSVNGQVLEKIELVGQKLAGLKNNGQCLTVRKLRTRGEAPGVIQAGGFLTLVDSELVGGRDASRGPAILAEAAIYARDVTTSGYAQAIAGRQSRGGQAGPKVEEFTSEEPVRLFPGSKRPQPLAIEETPELPLDDPATWANVVKFGANPVWAGDSSAGIQAAIDSGATTVYFPQGGYQISKPILLRGKVRRLLGFNSVIDYNGTVKPALRVENGDAPVVAIDGFFPLGAGVVNASSRTLMVLDSELRSYEATAGGRLFVEDCVAGPWILGRQQVWARQLNVENEGTHVALDGGQLYVLGLKTERGGTILEVKNGGRARIEGGFSYTTTAGKLAPMFVTTDASLSASFAEVCYSGDPFATLLRETRRGITKILERTDPRWTGRFGLYEAASD